MYELLTGSTQAAIASINALVAERRTTRTDDLVLCNWRGDPQLNEVVSNIKVLSRRIARDCTKLVLVGCNAPSPNELGSLIGEMMAQIDEYSSYFINAFGSCSVSSHLFLLVANPVTYMLEQLVQLADTLKAGQFEAAPRVAGAITETANVTIDKNLPATNKVAYRRALMSKVQTLKETIAEFNGYIAKSEASLAAEETPSADNEEEHEDMDDMDDMDEGTYTPEELVVMQSCLALLQDTQGVLKASLDGMTEVADALIPLIPLTPAVNNTVFDESPAGMAAASAADEDILACKEWVARVVRTAEQVELAAVNFGAELYSPLENVRTTQNLYTGLKTAVGEALDLLSRGAQATTVNCAITYRNIYTQATNTAIDQYNVNALSSSLTGLTM